MPCLLVFTLAGQYSRIAFIWAFSTNKGQPLGLPWHSGGPSFFSVPEGYFADHQRATKGGSVINQHIVLDDWLQRWGPVCLCLWAHIPWRTGLMFWTRGGHGWSQ